MFWYRTQYTVIVYSKEFADSIDDTSLTDSRTCPIDVSSDIVRLRFRHMTRQFSLSLNYTEKSKLSNLFLWKTLKISKIIEKMVFPLFSKKKYLLGRSGSWRSRSQMLGLQSDLGAIFELVENIVQHSLEQKLNWYSCILKKQISMMRIFVNDFPLPRSFSAAHTQFPSHFSLTHFLCTKQFIDSALSVTTFITFGTKVFY